MLTLRPSLMRAAAGLVAAGLVATAFAPNAPAAQLDEQTCDQLKREAGQLDEIGARANLAKGAAWGKANLSSAQLEQVKKLIEIDETVAFRCPRPRAVAEVPAAAIAKVKGKQAPKGAPKIKPGEAAKRAAAAQQKDQAPAQPKGSASANAAAGAPAIEGQTAAKARPKAAAPAAKPATPVPKAAAQAPKAAAQAPKAQDAYVPPPKAAAPAN